MLHDIRLRDFRCFRDLHFQPGPTKNFLIAPNASGKTSLLEAVCVLLRLQSPRTSSLGELMRFGAGSFHLSGHCAETHLEVAFAESARRISLDSKPQSRSADYLDVARVAWFANPDMELVTGSGSVRRRFLDFSGTQCEPAYRTALRSYEKALRSRNALLREGRPRREIEAFDPPLLESGEVLRAARERIVTRLAPLASTACTEISARHDALTLDYRAECPADFAAALRASRQEEDRLRTTVVGPHRDDLALLLGELPAGTYASEGQQRSIALSLKLAQARDLEQQLARPPIFLLDDIFGELDPARRNRLLAALPSSAQVLITTTFLDWAADTGDVWHLKEHEIQKS